MRRRGREEFTTTEEGQSIAITAEDARPRCEWQESRGLYSVYIPISGSLRDVLSLLESTERPVCCCILLWDE
jgi:hypothetical protein